MRDLPGAADLRRFRIICELTAAVTFLLIVVGGVVRVSDSGLGCGPAGQYVQPFDEAVFSQPVGEVGEPVETEFGFHVILVTDRSTPTFEDVRPDVEAALAQEVETAFGEWFTGALESTDVTVDPRYGTWDPT